jgi:CDP-glucose 4,6-dehydratase
MPRWSVEEAIEKTVEWTKVYFNKNSIPEIMDKQINEFINWNE